MRQLPHNAKNGVLLREEKELLRADHRTADHLPSRPQRSLKSYRTFVLFDPCFHARNRVTECRTTSGPSFFFFFFQIPNASLTASRVAFESAFGLASGGECWECGSLLTELYSKIGALIDQGRIVDEGDQGPAIGSTCSWCWLRTFYW